MQGKCGGERGVKFIGDDGWVFIHVHGGNLEASSPALLKEVLGPNEEHLGRSKGHHLDFIECIKSRGEPKAACEIGHHSATMCHMINLALRTGKKLKWDPDKELFDDDEANRMMQPSIRGPWQL
jgi:hypothetical protein